MLRELICAQVSAAQLLSRLGALQGASSAARVAIQPLGAEFCAPLPAQLMALQQTTLLYLHILHLVLKELVRAQVSVAMLTTASVPDDVGKGKVIMPVGNISATVLPVGLTDQSTALCDDGATIDCFLTLDSVIPVTFDKSQGGPLTIGDKSASLSSNGVYLYNIKRCGVNGTCQDELVSGHHTPNGVANIMSESREVNVRQSRIDWCPGMARQIHTKYGDTIPLIMGSNGLGFLTIRPITDRSRIIKLLKRSTLTPRWLLDQMAPIVMTSSIAPQIRAAPSPASVVPLGTTAQLHTIELPLTAQLDPPTHAIECLCIPVPVNMAAPALARQLGGATTGGDAAIIAAIASNDISFDSYVTAVTAAKMALAGVGLAGKLPTLTPFQILVRVHCILGHATLNTCLATIACAATLPKGFITTHKRGDQRILGDQVWHLRVNQNAKADISPGHLRCDRQHHPRD